MPNSVARFTLDSASEFLLGASVNSLDAPLPMPYNSPAAQFEIATTASTRFARAFATAQVTLLGRIELGNIWPLSEMFQNKMTGPMAEIRSFIDPIVRNAITMREKGGTTDGETLLRHLLDVTDGLRVHLHVEL